MKKKFTKITGLFVAGIMICPVFALETITQEAAVQEVAAPVFEQFLQTDIVPKYSGRTGIMIEKVSGIFLTASLVGSPIGVPLILHSNEREKANYWNSRKEQFNISLASCNRLQDTASRNACYTQLRASENQKNINYYAENK